METNTSSGTSRRDFMKQVAVAAATTMGSAAASAQTAGVGTQTGAGGVGGDGGPLPTPPWYRRAVRWGQTNITESDVENYDIAWWRGHWKRTAVQGVIINAGGIVAYYPSQYPLHHRPALLKDRDLYGELARAAHEDGLVVVARMDSSKTYEPMYRAHPDWFAMDAAGQPYRSGEYYLTCINSAYYEACLPDIMREIVERSHPEGFADNNWSGMGRNEICYCANCAERFRKVAGKALPTRHDWNDAGYKAWIDWNYARRLEQWDFNNKVTREAGGKDCLWVGMNGSGIGGQSASFRDMKGMAARAEIFLLDNQSRTDAVGFQENAHAGKLIHGLVGWDKVVPESMAMYQHGRPQYRVSSKSRPEAQMWMVAGFAGGIQPWWHHVGAYHEDRRMYRTAEAVMRWHATNESYLVNRTPVASVGLGWSQRNQDFFGRDNAEELVELPARGFMQALIRARIPYVPIHLDDLERDGAGLAVLILPNVGAMSEGQVAAVRKFVGRGGALVASGQTGLFDEWGEARPDFALGDLLGVKGGKGVAAGGADARNRGGGAADLHTYLRLTPELRGGVYGPKRGDEPVITGKRHTVLAGFEETDILPFGGTLGPLTVTDGAQVLLTFIPAFPVTPPEISYMRQPRTDIPGLVVNEGPGGRVVYLAADIDRRFAMNNFPDHGDLLANIIRWAVRDTVALDVQGPGLLNCELYQQASRLILHVVNLTSAGTWRAPLHELIPVGPLQIKMRLPKGMEGKMCRTLVAGGGRVLAGRVEAGWARFELASVADHEVVVVE